MPNRYQFQLHLPLPGSANRKQAIGEVVDLAPAVAQGRRHGEEEDSDHAGHDAGQSTVLSNIGWLHILLGDYRRAIACCEEALPVLTALNADRAEAGCLDNLGYVHHQLGNPQRALACCAKALDMFGQVGDRYSRAAVLTHIGDCHESTGDRRAAREAWREALDILHDLDHPDADEIRGKLAQ